MRQRSASLTTRSVDALGYRRRDEVARAHGFAVSRFSPAVTTSGSRRGNEPERVEDGAAQE
jgi:hypothetical protein